MWQTNDGRHWLNHKQILTFPTSYFCPFDLILNHPPPSQQKHKQHQQGRFRYHSILPCLKSSWTIFPHLFHIQHHQTASFGMCRIHQRRWNGISRVQSKWSTVKDVLTKGKYTRSRAELRDKRAWGLVYMSISRDFTIHRPHSLTPLFHFRVSEFSPLSSSLWFFRCKWKFMTLLSSHLLVFWCCCCYDFACLLRLLFLFVRNLQCRDIFCLFCGFFQNLCFLRCVFWWIRALMCLSLWYRYKNGVLILSNFSALNFVLLCIDLSYWYIFSFFSIFFSI